MKKHDNNIELRDYFAAAALQGIFSSWGECEGWEHNVKWAYIYADGMLAERDKRGGPIVSKQCITHHFACDCREEKFKELETENATLRAALVNADELERYSGSNGHRQWGRCSAWLNPDDAVIIISAKALDAARKEAKP